MVVCFPQPPTSRPAHSGTFRFKVSHERLISRLMTANGNEFCIFILLLTAHTRQVTSSLPLTPLIYERLHISIKPGQFLRWAIEIIFNKSYTYIHIYIYRLVVAKMKVIENNFQCFESLNFLKRKVTIILTSAKRPVARYLSSLIYSLESFVTVELFHFESKRFKVLTRILLHYRYTLFRSSLFFSVYCVPVFMHLLPR